MSDEQDRFQEWCVIELLGHRRLAGRVTEQQIGGAGMLRLDIYDSTGSDPAITQFYAPAAVYCITPTTEEIARRVGEQFRPQPVSRYELAPALAPPGDDDYLDKDYTMSP